MSDDRLHADVGDIGITEDDCTSIEILEIRGSLGGPSKEGRVGLERPRRIARQRFQQTHQFTTKQRHAMRSYTDYYITNVHRHILHMRSPSDTHAHVHTHYSLTFTPATLRSQYRVEAQQGAGGQKVVPTPDFRKVDASNSPRAAPPPAHTCHRVQRAGKPAYRGLEGPC